MDPKIQQIAQFGNGLQPPFDNKYTQGADTGVGAINNFELIVSNLIGLATTLGALFFIVQFVLAAITWITAGGDSGKIEKARGNMTNGIIGLIILVGAYAIIGLLGNILGIDILNFGQQISNIIPN